jgi:alpha-tubulin suppressor-like RCC1 family protein
VAVTGDLLFSKIDIGQYHSCGITTEGLAYCWGKGEDGQLGNGMQNDQSIPFPVDSLPL